MQSRFTIFFCSVIVHMVKYYCHSFNTVIPFFRVFIKLMFKRKIFLHSLSSSVKGKIFLLNWLCSEHKYMKLWLQRNYCEKEILCTNNRHKKSQNLNQLVGPLTLSDYRHFLRFIMFEHYKRVTLSYNYMS